MPIYEYRCQSCRKRFTKLLGIAQRDNPQPCPACGASVSKRLVSRVARLRSEDQMLDDLTDRMEFAGDPDDPQTMRRFMREMSAAMDEDPDAMEELFEEELAAEGVDSEA
ncbi:MAG: FmdB family transcriptional regulator [Fimbriimonadales bacterium]|nr:MAG: FmdB family transcriptional regulator [Fimbriimonadales bacterium]